MRWRILASGERWPIPGWRRSSRGAELDAEAPAARALECGLALALGKTALASHDKVLGREGTAWADAA
jgi:hypothetical protein